VVHAQPEFLRLPGVADQYARASGSAAVPMDEVCLKRIVLIYGSDKNATAGSVGF
jgi:hypothetical protein